MTVLFFIGAQIESYWIIPSAMESIPEGLFGAQDTLPQFYRIALRTSRRDTTYYSPHLSMILGQHAVHYIHLHYFSAGSSMVVANAYLRFRRNAQGFVEHLVREGMPPRQAAYLWTIISPEMMHEPGGNSSVSEGEEVDSVDAEGQEQGNPDEMPNLSVVNPPTTSSGSGGESQHVEYMDIDTDDIEYIDTPDEEENTQV
ncbi:hypothetical protein M407DRAFT_22497 [Tulasnella calospora MUT 4182]|uniref:Uncharacterized protein n=1 Tax=Tulasnella calospora MUT 4182 TaxID=1051891 RepID=A0A0C3L3H9_9AGAM|nr:hypothetical protein M407DRAFT_22497 [Tulasnella calospora MUT 4182]